MEQSVSWTAAFYDATHRAIGDLPRGRGVLQLKERRHQSGLRQAETVFPPHIGEQITAWGVVRHDGLHNWWELHPLIGWQPGNVAAPPGTGTGGSD